MFANHKTLKPLLQNPVGTFGSKDPSLQLYALTVTPLDCLNPCSQVMVTTPCDVYDWLLGLKLAPVTFG